MSKFNGLELTADTIQATRQHFADIGQDCIDDVVSGLVKVNNLDSYVAWKKQSMEDALSGKNDHTLTFLQRAYWIQTGEMLALLP